MGRALTRPSAPVGLAANLSDDEIDATRMPEPADATPGAARVRLRHFHEVDAATGAFEATIDDEVVRWQGWTDAHVAELQRRAGHLDELRQLGFLAVADRSGLSHHLGEVGGGTADELAKGAGLDARYVQEVLSGLAAAGVVEYDPHRGRFHLPPEHALFIADESSPYFMGGFFDMLPTLLSKVDQVAIATRQGGGVPFAAFGDMVIRGIDRSNTPSQTVFLVDRWLPAVPGLLPALEVGARVADVGCGSGTVVSLIARAFPNTRVHGFDVSGESVEMARARAGDLPNAEFTETDVSEIPIEPPFRLITAFDVIHDLPDPLAGMRRNVSISSGGKTAAAPSRWRNAAASAALGSSPWSTT